MSDKSVGWPSRILGGIIGGAGTWFAIQLSGWELDPVIAGGASAGMAVAGLYLGAKIWEAVVSLA